MTISWREFQQFQAPTVISLLLNRTILRISFSNRQIWRMLIPFSPSLSRNKVTAISNNIGSKSFRKTPFSANKMYSAISEKRNLSRNKMEVPAWSHNRTLGIFSAITDRHKMPVPIKIHKNW